MNRLRKIPKILLISLLLVTALLAGFHFWLIAHAKKILEEYVSVQSNGKYRLQVKKVKYDYLKLRLEVQQPDLKSVDTSINDKFEMHAQDISIQLEKLWPLIMDKRLLIDSISMNQPYFNVILQKNNGPQKQSFSLSGEMEKIYKSIQSVLTTLKVGNFRINKGVFALNYSSQKTGTPLEIKNIDFYIKGLIIDSSSISQKPNSYSQDIQLKIGGQTIQFPEGSKSVQFSSFRFNVNTGNLDADSCSISSTDKDSTTANFRLFAEKMRIRNVYLASNDSIDVNRIDSLFFTRPKVSFSINISASKKDSSETISTAIKRITSSAFGKILIKYVSINNVDFDIDVERKEKTSTFNFVQDRLEITNLGLGLFPSMPVSADNIRFGLKEFVDYFRDSTYLIHFDSVRINNEQFSLFRFKIESTERVKKGEQIIYIPVLQIHDIDWLQLLTQKRLVASNFTLNNPYISIVAAGNGKTKTYKKTNSIDSLLRQMFLLKNIAIRNGKMNYAFPGNGYIQINNINTEITPGELNVPGSITSVQKMIRQLRTGELIYSKDGWRMTAEDIVYEKDNKFRAASIDLTNSAKDLRIKANNVSVSGMLVDTKAKSLDIGKISWGNANIIMDLSIKKDVEVRSNLRLSVGGISGGSTELKLDNKDIHVNAKISKLKTAGIVWGGGALQKLNNLSVEGTTVDFDAGETRCHTGKFIVNDMLPSEFNSVTANFIVNKTPLNFSVPSINFEADIQQAIQKQYAVRWLKITRPQIEITLHSSNPGTHDTEQKSFPEINLGKIEITDPVISFQQPNNKIPLHLQLGKSSLSADGLKTSHNGDRITLKNIKFLSDDLSINDKDSLQVHAANGRLDIGLEAFVLHSKLPGSQGKWELLNGSLDLSNMNLLNKRKSGQEDTIQLTAFHLSKLSMDQNEFKNPILFFSSKPLASLSTLNLIYKNENSRYRIKGLQASPHSISLDSFSFHPQLDLKTFMETQPFQKDYLHVETGAIDFNDIDAGAWLKDSVIKLGHIRISNAELTDTRDKNLPFQADVIKPLPVNLFRKIPFNTSIDSINVDNAKIVYNEVSEKTKQTGTIQFNQVKAVISNIKNYNLSTGDSLQIIASGRIMDTAFLQLRIKEAYDPRMPSFLIIVRAEPFNLQLLNPFLLPAVSVKIKSGFTELLEMKAIGGEYVALGEMKFLYHNLKVEFLKGGNEQKKTLLTSLKTFAANSLVIKKNNSKRVGKVYYERSRNRSFFNYLVRMVASGGASSVGARRNKKYNRIYKSKIKEVKLPEVDF